MTYECSRCGKVVQDSAVLGGVHVEGDCLGFAEPCQGVELVGGPLDGLLVTPGMVAEWPPRRIIRVARVVGSMIGPGGHLRPASCVEFRADAYERRLDSKYYHARAM